MFGYGFLEVNLTMLNSISSACKESFLEVNLLDPILFCEFVTLKSSASIIPLPID
jgi:hypothetical protein